MLRNSTSGGYYYYVMEFTAVCVGDLAFDDLSSHLQHVPEGENLDQGEYEQKEEDNSLPLILSDLEEQEAEDPSWDSEMNDFIVPDYAPIEYTRLKKRSSCITISPKERRKENKQRHRKYICFNAGGIEEDEEDEEEKYSC